MGSIKPSDLHPPFVLGLSPMPRPIIAYEEGSGDHDNPRSRAKDMINLSSTRLPGLSCSPLPSSYAIMGLGMGLGPSTKGGCRSLGFVTSQHPNTKFQYTNSEKKHIKLEQKDPTSTINSTYNLQICYLFTNESIYLGFTILGFIWFLQTKSKIRTDLT